MSLKMNISAELPDISNPIQTGDATHRRNCRQLSDMFKRMAMGNLPASPDRRGVCHGYGTVEFSGCSGSLVVTIDGTSVTRTHAVSDDADGAAVADSINASAVLKPKVLARYNSTTNLLTIQSKVAGAAGNFHLAVSGTGLTASGAALTLGVDAVTLDMRTSAQPARGFIIASGGALSGAVGATIGGTTVTATAAGGDNQTLKLIAGAINANSTVNKWVRAKSCPYAAVQLTTTTADVITVTVNGVAHTVAGSTAEDDVGALLVTAINANLATHGCWASYRAGSDILDVVSLNSDDKVKLAISGAGKGSSSIIGQATQTITIDAVTADVITVTIDGVACSITSAGTDEDTAGAALVTAINAVSGAHKCTASYATGGGGGAAGTLTITSDYSGSVGNEITLAISGAGKGSSVVGGAYLTGGLDKVLVECRVPGVIGNAIGLVASGTNAAVSGAVLDGGEESRVTYTL